MRCGVAAPLFALSVTAAVLGGVAGLRWVALDEGAVVAKRAARYADETGGRAGDCIAVPGRGRVWLRVICEGSERRIYGVSRLGFDIDPMAADGI